jgi:hypothetical protein
MGKSILILNVLAFAVLSLGALVANASATTSIQCTVDMRPVDGDLEQLTLSQQPNQLYRLEYSTTDSMGPRPPGSPAGGGTKTTVGEDLKCHLVEGKAIAYCENDKAIGAGFASLISNEVIRNSVSNRGDLLQAQGIEMKVYLPGFIKSDDPNGYREISYTKTDCVLK